MKPLLQLLRNAAAIDLQDLGIMAAGPVERDGSGVPVAWRLFRFGAFSLTRDGARSDGQFLEEHAEAILAAHAAKGNPIPLDAYHALGSLATALGVDEAALAAAVPARRLALGFGSLARRADGLWLQDVEWTDLGRRLVERGLFRWFSPVVRGLQTPPLRVTSVALTNSPALDGLDALAASDDSDDDGTREAFSLADLVGKPAPIRAPRTKKEDPSTMKKLLELIGRLTGSDTAALEDAAALPEAAVAALAGLADELPALRAAGALSAQVRDSLCLAADADAGTVAGTLKGLLAKAEAHDTLQGRVDALELEAETARRNKIVERGLAEGKLTKAIVDGWAGKQDCAALEAFLTVAPVVVEPGRRINHDDLPPDGEVASLSEDDRAFAKTLHLTDEQMRAAKEAGRKA